MFFVFNATVLISATLFFHAVLCVIILFMEFYSLAFIIFLAAVMLVNYTIMKKHQWICLLAASLAFYFVAGGIHIVFILVTSLSIWLCGLGIERAALKYRAARKTPGIDSKQAKQVMQRSKRVFLITGLAVNLGILCYLKYWEALFDTNLGLVLPLGISFYTFQSISYLIDMYDDKYPAEKSYPRFLLFVSWFPQLLQGPIGRYDALKPQFDAQHSPDREKFGRALLLILFGLMKKYAVADMLTGDIAVLFDGGHAAELPGCLVVLGILLYSAQQYCDFSGGIDIVLGISSLLGIELSPNFRQPYFSVSLADFWRRWHISLGTWMRDYVFYPFALLKPMHKFSVWASKKFGTHIGRALPACIANILVFLVVGVWHGPELHYVLWGLYNGIVIALSELLAPCFASLGSFFHIKTDSRGFHIFRIIRTFIIVNIGWYFDRIYDFRESFACLAHTFTDFRISYLPEGFANTILNQTNSNPKYTMSALAIAAISLVIVFCVSFMKEKGIDVYSRFKTSNLVVRFGVLYLMLFLFLGSFMMVQNAGGFMYANF